MSGARSLVVLERVALALLLGAAAWYAYGIAVAIDGAAVAVDFARQLDDGSFVLAWEAAAVPAIDVLVPALALAAFAVWLVRAARAARVVALLRLWRALLVTALLVTLVLLNAMPLSPGPRTLVAIGVLAVVNAALGVAVALTGAAVVCRAARAAR